MNVNDPSQIRACTSCQLCGAVCPTSAITIKPNSQGFYRPQIEDEKCINCGLCVQNCYKFDHDIRKTSNWTNKRIFAGWAKDGNVVKTTTSGGIADILARMLIQKGYVCIGVSYDNQSNCAIGKIASTQEETNDFRGSKYIQSISVEAFKEFVSKQKNQKFAVFGLPCQVYAIDRFLRAKKNRDSHILIDLFCHGCPSLNLWKKYLKETFEKTEAKKVLSVNFRSKARGWRKYCIQTVVQTPKGKKTILSSKLNDPFYTLFFSDEILNDSCNDCEIRSTLEYTDIRLGDFWGGSYISNSTGVSGITICSKKGQEIFDDIKNEIHYEDQVFSNFLPFQSYDKNYSVSPELRAKLLQQLADSSVSLSTSKDTYLSSLPLKKRVLIQIKNIIKILPLSFESKFRKLVYSFHGS